MTKGWMGMEGLLPLPSLSLGWLAIRADDDKGVELTNRAKTSLKAWISSEDNCLGLPLPGPLVDGCRCQAHPV